MRKLLPGTAKAAPYVPGTAKAAPYVLLVAFAFTLNAQPPGGRAVHVTLHEGTSMAAALSPDGRTIAIDLLGTLWTMPAGGGVARPITDVSMDARQPAGAPGRHRRAVQAALR